MAELDTAGGFTVSANALAETKQLFAAGRADEAATKAMLKAAFAQGNGIAVDPHTAVGLAVAAPQSDSRAVPAEIPLVTLANAAPAQFPEAWQAAPGAPPALQPRPAG